MANWVLIRGLAREARHWDAFPEVLRKHDPKGTVLCMDPPGAGREFKRHCPTTMSGIAADMRRRWLASPPAPGPWRLLTLSMGGMIGMQWCAEYPEDFKSLVLINSSSRLSFPHHRMRLGNLPRLLEVLRSKDRLFQERRVLEMTSGAYGSDATIAKRWAEFSAECPITPQTTLRQLWAAMKFHVPPKLRLPVIVLSSKQDTFTHPRCSRALAKHFKAPLRIHPTAGHDLSLDDPEWVCRNLG